MASRRLGERNPDAIAALAARDRGDARLFSVGVSADVNATLIEQLAVEGHGTAHFVRDSESVERTVSLLARRLSTPVLTNVRVRVDGVRLSQVLPAGALDVFAGQDLVVLARYEGDGRATVRLEGESVDGPVTWSTSANFPSRSRENPFVARLWAAQRVGWLAAEKRKSGGNSEMDQEIKSLGERYGIPTEFSSYLVVEPGMQVAARAASNAVSAPSLQAVTTTGAAGAGGSISRKARSDVRDQAADAIAAPAAPLMTTNEARFEAAKASAEQRQMKSVAEMDALSKERSATERSIGSRRFTLASGVWTDARYTASMRTVTVTPFSPAYFALVQRFPELAEPFALGERVVVAGRSVAIALSPDATSAVSALDAAAIDAIARNW